MFIQHKNALVFFFYFVILLTNNYSMDYPQIENAENQNIKMTILYDNHVFTEGTKSDWGFACFIEGIEKIILFDTGTKSDILWYNVEKLNVDLSKVEQIVISHNHGDHTGGLQSVLDKNPDVTVFFPASAAHEFTDGLEGTGATIIKDIYLVFGGFHLMRHSDEQLKEIIQEFKKLGVKQCGPTHCTGDRAIALFNEAFGENYVPMEVKKLIEISN